MGSAHRPQHVINKHPNLCWGTLGSVTQWPPCFSHLQKGAGIFASWGSWPVSSPGADTQGLAAGIYNGH